MFRRRTLEAVGPWSADPATRWSTTSTWTRLVARRFSIRANHSRVVDYRLHGANASERLGTLLSHVLDRLEEERRLVEGDAPLEQACRDGQRYWQDLTGGWLL